MTNDKFCLDELYRMVEIAEHIDKSQIVKEDIEFVANNIRFAGQWMLYFFYYYLVHDKQFAKYDLVDARNKMMKIIKHSGPEIKKRMIKLLQKFDQKVNDL